MVCHTLSLVSSSDFLSFHTVISEESSAGLLAAQIFTLSAFPRKILVLSWVVTVHLQRDGSGTNLYESSEQQEFLISNLNLLSLSLKQFLPVTSPDKKQPLSIFSIRSLFPFYLQSFQVGLKRFLAQVNHCRKRQRLCVFQGEVFWGQKAALEQLWVSGPPSGKGSACWNRQGRESSPSPRVKLSCSEDELSYVASSKPL